MSNIKRALLLLHALLALSGCTMTYFTHDLVTRPRCDMDFAGYWAASSDDEDPLYVRFAPDCTLQVLPEEGEKVREDADPGIPSKAAPSVISLHGNVAKIGTAHYLSLPHWAVDQMLIESRAETTKKAAQTAPGTDAANLRAQLAQQRCPRADDARALQAVRALDPCFYFVKLRHRGDRLFVSSINDEAVRQRVQAGTLKGSVKRAGGDDYETTVDLSTREIRRLLQQEWVFTVSGKQPLEMHRVERNALPPQIRTAFDSALP